METVNSISESAIPNSSKPIKFAHLQKLANQPTLNDAHVVEMEVSHSMVARCREKRANWKKNQKMVKKYI